MYEPCQGSKNPDRVFSLVLYISICKPPKRIFGIKQRWISGMSLIYPGFEKIKYELALRRLVYCWYFYRIDKVRYEKKKRSTANGD
jgi:hypothetical protein